MRITRSRLGFVFVALVIVIACTAGVVLAAASKGGVSKSKARRHSHQHALVVPANRQAVRHALGRNGRLAAETVEVKGIVAHTKKAKQHNLANSSKPAAKKLSKALTALSSPLDTQFAGLDDDNIESDPLNVGGSYSSETDAAIGPKYYGEVVGLGVGFFDKSTGALIDDETLQEFYEGSGLGAGCDTSVAESFIEPHILYDSQSDRWIVMSEAETNEDTTELGEDFECIAASRTGDPINGGWNFYKVPLITAGALWLHGSGAGVWTDGIYFEESIGCKDEKEACPGLDKEEGLVGTQVWDFNRSDLESGAPLRYQTTQGVGGIGSGNFAGARTSTTFSNLDADGVMPANLETMTGTPPAGRNEYFMSDSDLNQATESTGYLDIWQWHVDWSNPANSWIGQSKESQIDYQVTTPKYGVPDVGSNAGEKITSAGPSGFANKLETQFDYLAQKPQYTNFGGSESLWIAHSTSLCEGSKCKNTGPDRVRWEQIGITSATGAPVTSGPTQGQDYAPAPTSLNRWLASLAVDKNGDMGLGYTGTNSTVFPSLYVAGQESVTSAAAGTATISTIPETEAFTGHGYQTGEVSGSENSFFGPEDMVALDPNGCEMWFTGQVDIGSPKTYSEDGWATEVTSFHFPGCTPSTLATSLTATGEGVASSKTGTLTATLTATGTSSGVVDEPVTFTLGGTKVGTARTNSNGVATLSGVDTSAYSSGTTASAVGASYAGDSAYNYGSSSTSGSLLVGAAQSISFGALSNKTYGNASFEISATASSGLPVAFTASGGGTCSVSGTTVTITAAGLCTITATQAGNETTLAAAPVERTFTIAQETQTIAVTGAWSTTTQSIGTSFKATATSSSGGTMYFETGDANCTAVDNGDTPQDTFLPAHAPGCVIVARQDGTTNVAPASLKVTVPISGGGAQTGKFALAKTSYALDKIQNTLDSVTWTDGLPSSTWAVTGGTVAAGSIAAASTASVGTALEIKEGTLTTGSSVAACTNGTATFSGKTTVTYAPGELVTISGATVAGYNLSNVPVRTVPTTKTFTYCVGSKLAEAKSALAKGVGAITESGTTATAYLQAAPPVALAAGQKLNLAGTSVAGYNNKTVTVLSAPTTTSFTFTAESGLGNATGGTVGTEATGASAAGGIATVKLASAPTVALEAGNTITIAGVTNTTFNGTFTILTVPSSTSFTYSDAAATTASGAGAISVTGTSCAEVNTTAGAETLTALHVGTCTVTATQSGNGDYAAGTATITYTLTAGTQSLTWSPVAGTISDAGNTAVSTTTNSGLSPGTVTSTTPAICTVGSTSSTGGKSSVTVTPVADGSCVLSAAGNAGSEDWNALSATNVTYTVANTSGPANQTITFGKLPPLTLAGTPAPLTATASSGLPVSFASSTASVCTTEGANGKTLKLLTAGTCTIVASQEGEAGTYNAATNVSQSFTVTKADQVLAFKALANKPYGSADFGLAGALAAISENISSPTIVENGEVTGLAVSYAASGACTVDSAGVAVHLTEAGVCTITASQSGNSTYNAASSIALQFKVLPVTSSITFANPGTQSYGTAAFSGGATATSGAPVTYTASGACSISSGLIQVGSPGSCTVTAHGVGTANYAPPAAVSQTFSVVKASQTINFTVAKHTFGEPDFTIGATATSGKEVAFSKQSGECTLTGTTVHITGKGTCTIAADQAGDSNYEAAEEVVDTFSIEAASQTITFPAIPDQTYGSGPVALKATASSGLEVSYEASGPCSISGETVLTTGVGTCEVTASQEGNANYNAASAVTRSFKVSDGEQTITFANPGTQTYGEPDFAPNATTSSGLPVTYTASGNCLITEANLVHLTGAGSCTVKANQAGNGVYAPAEEVDRTFSIEKSGQTITFAKPSEQTYGEPPFAPGASASSGLSVSYSASGECSIDEAGLVEIDGAGSCTVTASQEGNSNYEAAPPVSRTFSIAKAGQTISFFVAEHTYGEPDFTISATATSGKEVTFEVKSGQCTLSGSLVHLTGAGSCTIAATQPGDANYSAAKEVDDTFTINGDSQTITFPAISGKAYGEADFDPGATASSGLAVSYTASGACSIVSGKVHIIETGVCTVVASQPGNSNYEPASNVEREFAVGKATQTIAFNQPAPTSYGAAPVTLSATASSGLGVTFSGTGSCTVTSSGTLTATAAGSCEVTATQAGNGDYEAATSVTRTVTIEKMAVKVTLRPAAKKAAQGKVVKYKVVVTGAVAGHKPASGTVTISVNGSPVTTQVLGAKGFVTYKYTIALPGSATAYPVVASFSSGDSNYANGSASGTLTVKSK